MKKVFALLLFATMLYSAGVTANAPIKKIVGEEVSKIEKSCSGTVTEFINPALDYQDDVYFIETTCYGNYTLPKFEEVYIEVPETPPILAQGR